MIFNLERKCSLMNNSPSRYNEEALYKEKESLISRIRPYND